MEGGNKNTKIHVKFDQADLLVWFSFWYRQWKNPPVSLVNKILYLQTCGFPATSHHLTVSLPATTLHEFPSLKLTSQRAWKNSCTFVYGLLNPIYLPTYLSTYLPIYLSFFLGTYNYIYIHIVGADCITLSPRFPPERPQPQQQPPHLRCCKQSSIMAIGSKGFTVFRLRWRDEGTRLCLNREHLHRYWPCEISNSPPEACASNLGGNHIWQHNTFKFTIFEFTWKWQQVMSR